MAATEVVTGYGRIATYGGDVTAIPVTFGGNGASYATASGGLPVDLVAVLTGGTQIGGGAGPFSMPYINPNDVVGIQPLGLSTNGYIPFSLVVGIPTYTAASYPFTGGSINAVHPVQQLATCPATIRLIGIGAAVTNHAAFGEVADGANTDTFTCLVLIARGGTAA